MLNFFWNCIALYLQHGCFAQTELSVPICSIQDGCGLYLSTNMPSFSCQIQISPLKYKENVCLAINKFFKTDLFRNLQISKLVHSWEPKVTKCLKEENKALFNSSTLMNSAPQRIRILTLKKTRDVCKAGRFVIRPSMTL